MSLEVNGQCRSCGAPMYWTTSSRGKNIPLDPEPVDNGNLVIVERDGQERAVAPGLLDSTKETYVSHFATCPDRKRWRKED